MRGFWAAACTRLIWGAALLAAGAGCGSGTATVSGVVTFQGKPLPGGQVSLVPPKGPPALIGFIKEDGSYSIVNVPVGEVKIMVTTQPPLPELPSFIKVPGRTNDPNSTAKSAPYKPLGEYVKIPDRYRLAETSGLTLKVKRGENRYDIPLEP